MKNIKSIKRLFRNLDYILDKKQKWRSAAVFASMFVCSLTELLGVSMIYPFLLLMMDEDALRNNSYLSWIHVIWPNISNRGMIIILAIGIAFVYVIKNALSIVCTYIQAAYSTKINRELSVKMLKSYMMRPYEYFVNTHSKYIIRGLGGDIASVYGVLSSGFDLCAGTITIVMIVIYLMKIDVFVASVSIVAGGICLLAITLGFKGIMKRLGGESRGLAAESPGYTYQLINGIKEITVLDRKDYFVDGYNDFQKKGAAITRKTTVINSAPNCFIEAACVIVVITVLSIRISQGVDMSTFLPGLGAFAMGIFRIMPSIAKLSSRVNNIVYYLPGLDNVYSIMKDAEQLKIDYDAEEAELARLMEENHYDKLSFNNEILVKGVHWRYKNSTEDVLDGLSLVVHKGESIGLIGSSGGGKSTLVDILMTLFKPQSGKVMMDGVDIFLMKYRWRSLIGYVPQSVYLTGGSVRSNVAFGLPDDKIIDEKVWKALEQAQLREFIESLPERLDTPVGEHGVMFSGGQRQRVAIARALYNQPEILILDEATAALDNKTERAFMEAIEALQGEKTIIIVAHRLTTVRNCDRIYEIRDGIAIERSVQEVVAEIPGGQDAFKS